ncbi:signal recognition particle-docking protein FtsY [Pseudoalteromonas viridis]|uniref:Signal recognition particle receptor FtsY n=1 Tax=Pseudoalteromonas viridis TaxID=339617 RepID=A0ABX7V818_9GAMM|nr:signal recognition particle-docking protein FtsY [Pseudoalteromonas viridis]QTL37041.1 signal recognition particle-docking protein FtsY [Pseudoalteromonas viridis]
MGKKSKILSWLGFGKSDKKQQEAEREAARLAEEQAKREEAERLAKEQAEREEAERLAKEQAEREEAERLAKEQAEREEAERLAKEQAEREEAARLAKEQAEREEAERLAKEQAEREEVARLAKEQAEREEAARLAKEQAEREEAARLAKEQAEREEAERLAKEQAEREEAERLAKEQAEREEAERLAKEQAEREEAERLAKEQAEREEAERLAKEQAEREEAERLAKEQAEREEAERLAKEQAEREEAERLAKEQAEREEAERLAKEQAEREEAERLAKEQAEREAQEQEKPKKKGFFARLKQGLLKTKTNIGSGFANIFRGKKIDDELFEDLETQLLTADIGVDTTMKLIDSLTDAADRKQLKDGDALYDLMKQEMADILKEAEKPLEIPATKKPFVILMVGVNGVGKTTTIGKMAKQFQAQGKSVMLAAGDTFRAAAVEQLQVWGERNDIPVIAQHTGADSASVVFDAFQAAQARDVDVLIADTAGRLQNKDNLMQELEKIARVMKKLDPDAPHEVMLTIDAGTGQNAISQVKLFDQAVGLTGITLTKLDGTAKGGVIFAVADQFKVPIRYIGVGESIDDLRTFKSDDFIEALFSQENQD